jgi:hypothetical protein
MADDYMLRLHKMMAHEFAMQKFPISGSLSFEERDEGMSQTYNGYLREAGYLMRTDDEEIDRQAGRRAGDVARIATHNMLNFEERAKRFQEVLDGVYEDEVIRLGGRVYWEKRKRL